MKLKVLSGKFKDEIMEVEEITKTKVVIQKIPAKILEWGLTSEKEMNWEDAKQWCEKQGEGWRLPTIIELEQAYNDKINGFEASYYWSSTEYSQTGAWIYSWPGAYRFSSTRDYDYYVRCVRGRRTLGHLKYMPDIPTS